MSEKEEAKLKELKERKKERHIDYELKSAEYCLLPFFKYKIKIEVKKNVGPRDLDKVFFKLLEKGVNTKKEIKKCLGINKWDGFIIEHLDLLVKDKYVEKNEKKI